VYTVSEYIGFTSVYFVEVHVSINFFKVYKIKYLNNGTHGRDEKCVQYFGCEN